jgi:hypothetical protein
MDIVKRCRWLLLLAASSTAVAGEVRIEFASSYVAKPQPDGNIEVLVTVTAKLPLVHGGIASSGPLGAALDQAANKECPHGYSWLEADLQKTRIRSRQLTLTQRSLIKCNGT